MSVRVNDRHLSDIEYENTFSIFNQYISNKLRNLPKRYRHFLGEPFNNILNEIYEDIMKMTSLYLDGKPTSIERYRLGIGILKKIEIVKSLSYTMWNLSSDRKNEIKFIKQKSREFWTESLNKEEIVFLNKLAQLQRIVYKIAIQTSKDYKDAQVEMLVKLSRSAFYNAVEGNAVFIEDETSYKKRKRLFSDAIGDLYAMSRPIRELSCFDMISEKDLEEMCNLITDSIRLIRAIKNSDEEKYTKK